MSDLLALDWEKHQLSGVEAHVARGRVRVRHCFRLSWPDGLDIAGQPEEAGRWLADELRQRGIRTKQVLVSLSREETIVRQLEIPDVSDDELPDIVRLQAETKTSSSLDRMAFDFLPLPRLATEGRHVLTVTMPRERLDGLMAVIAAAGLELESVGISPTAAAELAARAEQKRGAGPDETSLIVARHGRRVEISMMRSQHLIFTHSTQVTGADDEQDSRLALAEIRRSHGSLARLDPSLAISRTWVLGTDDETAVLRRVLGENLGYEILPLDPAADAGIDIDPAEVPGVHSHYAGPLGMLLARLATTVPAADLLNPRKSLVRPDRRRLWIAAGAAAVVLLIAALFVTVRLRAAGIQVEIDTEQAQIARIEDAIKNGASLLKNAGTARDWDRRNVDLLAQLQGLRDAVENPEALYLVELRFASSTGGRVAGEITGTGHAKTRADAERLYASLSAKGFDVRSSEINRDSKDSDYPFTFGLSVLVPLKGTPAVKAATR